MIRKETIGLIFVLVMGNSVWGQSDYDSMATDGETTSLMDFFAKGEMHGHARNYFMATINKGDLSDYWTNATGGVIQYQTGNWKGLRFGVKRAFAFQTFSSDLNQQDENVLKGAKWEKELYDINRPYKNKDLDRLEELYVKYNYKNSFITFGKIDINTGPFLLRRDGRMKPFVYRGFWGELHEIDNQTIYLGWINGVSPRGMTEWYSINEAIGILNNGFQNDGSNAVYHKKAETRGIGVLGYKLKIKDISIQFWDHCFDRLFNSIWSQLDYKKNHFFGGIQYVTQNASKNQKNITYENRYFQPDEVAHVFALQVGYRSIDNSLKISSSVLNGGGTGRFLFPKELGRENFYVSQPRSWIDGYGLVNVYMIRGEYIPNDDRWEGFSVDLRMSYTDAPSRSDFASNKYGRTDFAQVTLDTKYVFQEKLKGLVLSFLYIGKFSPNHGLTPKETFYETNLHHINLITNINF